MQAISMQAVTVQAITTQATTLQAITTYRRRLGRRCSRAGLVPPVLLVESGEEVLSGEATGQRVDRRHPAVPNVVQHHRSLLGDRTEQGELTVIVGSRRAALHGQRAEDAPAHDLPIGLQLRCITVKSARP